MATSAAEQAAMTRALELAATAGVPLGPNPRVGCVLLDDDGRTVAEGRHRGAGTPHAEADALARAGDAARGTTAVVTLEPCNHHGRTPPCAQALVEAGVRRVVAAMPDPNPEATGGTETLRAAGIEVETGLREDEARRLNRAWLFGLEHHRPWVTWKLAASLDGRSAAADGTSLWITGRESRRDVHRLRSEADVMLVGTGTVLHDDPRLTVRDAEDRPLEHQPLRVIMGMRTLDDDLNVFLGEVEESFHIRTRNPGEALLELFVRGRRHVFLEGGPTLAAAFLRAGLVDEIVAYVAPVLLGAGTGAVGDLGITTIDDAFRPVVTDVTRVGDDVRYTLIPKRPQEA